MADIDFGNAVTVPGEGLEGFWDRFSNLTKDRNFMSLLAGVGSRLGRGGVGEALGVPAQQMIQSMATQEALAAGEAKREKWNNHFFNLVSGGFTPREIPGPTSMKVGPDNITLDISTAKPPANADNATATGATAPAAKPGKPVINPAEVLGAVTQPGFVGANGGVEYAQPPAGGGVPMSTPKLNLTDVLGFWPTPSR